eukprot:5156-Heterococcus_DN1.PRE.2
MRVRSVFSSSSVGSRIHESGLHLTFTPNSARGWNVQGQGSNKYGNFNVTGVLDQGLHLEMYRFYLATGYVYYAYTAQQHLYAALPSISTACAFCHPERRYRSPLSSGTPQHTLYLHTSLLSRLQLTTLNVYTERVAQLLCEPLSNA